MAVFKEDSGPADGLNNGFAQATGDIYGFVNAMTSCCPALCAALSVSLSQA